MPSVGITSTIAGRVLFSVCSALLTSVSSREKSSVFVLHRQRHTEKNNPTLIDRVAPPALSDTGRIGNSLRDARFALRPAESGLPAKTPSGALLSCAPIFCVNSFPAIAPVRQCHQTDRQTAGFAIFESSYQHSPAAPSNAPFSLSFSRLMCESISSAIPCEYGTATQKLAPAGILFHTGVKIETGIYAGGFII